jgi:hypothetical protein
MRQPLAADAVVPALSRNSESLQFAIWDRFGGWVGDPAVGGDSRFRKCAV